MTTKYPIILFFRYDTYSHIDSFFEKNKNNIEFSYSITNNVNELNQFFDSNCHLLFTFGPSFIEYQKEIEYYLPIRMKNRIIHIINICNINEFNRLVNTCYINYITSDITLQRPIFSLFTTCYKSYDRIFRAYNSIKEQKLRDWEWVILDDSPEEDHFIFLTNIFKKDKRIRLYKRSQNSGSIGNVKNEAVMLCRGKYVLEMDHDDEILPDTLLDATNAFEKNPDVGFIYMNFVNIYENGDNFSYGDFFGLGYSGYYCQKYKNKWVNVAISPNINNISLSHIVSVPNHPRIWRKSSLMDMGNYSEYLPVCDDYELILRTSVNTKMAKLPKLGYIQYMNNNNNNFSLIRNQEINRLCRPYLYQHCFESYKINDVMKSMDAFEDPRYASYYTQIWKRKDYTYKYCNKIINLQNKKQYCIIGINAFIQNKIRIQELYSDSSNDFLLLDNENSIDILTKELDNSGLDGIKCYSMKDNTKEELIKYFHLIYKSCSDVEIITYLESKEKLTEESKEKITIITPCMRTENLIKLKESIDFDYVNEWIIVYDGKHVTSIPNSNIFNNNPKIKEYIYKGEGISGNPQRNFALELIENENTYIYFLDDDNIIHPDLYSFLDTISIEDRKMYTFDQERPENVFPYTNLLQGNKIEVSHIDTAMLLIHYKLCKHLKWIYDCYKADGFYIKECYELNKENWIYVNKTLSYYNRLL
uniref:Glycosyltransferase 2-like domain-containing protein n=1 Tax=viral metagenome TaxID=1070528 RepID=A0A6C0B150_9ZZZZ